MDQLGGADDGLELLIRERGMAGIIGTRADHTAGEDHRDERKGAKGAKVSRSIGQWLV
jgi:hypothetical protein